jgi:hypothetical protein
MIHLFVRITIHARAEAPRALLTQNVFMHIFARLSQNKRRRRAVTACLHQDRCNREQIKKADDGDESCCCAALTIEMGHGSAANLFFACNRELLLR